MYLQGFAGSLFWGEERNTFGASCKSPLTRQILLLSLHYNETVVCYGKSHLDKSVANELGFKNTKLKLIE